MIIPDTEVRLISSVPLSKEHQMTFNSKAEQTSFFYNKSSINFSDFTYQREHQTVQVGRGRDELYTCNYLMFRNEHFTDKWFYAFITKLEYVNPNMTRVHFEIDVYQTWQFDLQFKPSFIDREHQNRWQSNGLPVLNTVDEGLDYGSEYETVSVTQHTPYPNDIVFLVIVAKETMHGGSADKGKIQPMTNGSPQPLSYYIHPITLGGGSPTTSVGGTNINISTVYDVLKNMYTQTGAVNNIVNIYVTDYIGVHLDYSGGVLDFPMSWFEHATIQDDTGSVNTLYLKVASQYIDKVDTIGNKYDGYANVSESKLLMYPYTVTILTDMKGNHQEIKNEYIEGSSLKIRTKGSIGTSNKVSYNVDGYLGQTGVNVLDTAIINQSANDVPIVTELLSAYLQGNRNQLQNQTNQIAFNSIAGTIGSAFGSIGQALARNPVGAVAGIGQIGQNAMSAHFQLEGMLAKKQDLQATPPQLSQMGGNTAFDYGNGIHGVYVIKKQITAEYRKKLTDYFKMFGYKVNEVKQPNLKTRQHFNYIRTIGANITGNIPHEDLTQLKEMFNNGITLWHGDWVGDYSLSNGEV